MARSNAHEECDGKGTATVPTDGWDAAVMTPRESGATRAWVDAYLTRLGLDRVEVHLAGHRGGMLALAEAHARLVPYENLAIYRGEGIQSTVDGVVDKIVRRRQGGVGIELNGGLAALLDALGYDVDLRGAAVLDADGRPGPPMMHAVTVVRLPEPWLVDVGFSADAFALPIEGIDVPRVFDGSTDVERRVQAVGGGVPDAAAELEVSVDGTSVYRVETPARRLDDFAPAAWWYSTSPESSYRQSPVCSRATSRGRVAVFGRHLVDIAEGRRTERRVDDDAELLELYRRRFGLHLTEIPQPL